MALNKTQLQNDIIKIMNDAFKRTANPSNSIDLFAAALADKIDSYIKNATVTLPAGSVVVTGTAATQSNPAPIVVTPVIT